MKKTKAQELNITKFPYYEKDNKGNVTYHETSYGDWYKSEYDKHGNENYCEWSDGSWCKCKYDEKGNKTYYESSSSYGDNIYYFII